jgi:DNA (cytosine-5)-methyltransferase 1
VVKKGTKQKNAIDLYSGIGGWSLGFKLAGVNVVSSYENWKPAITTHEKNFDSKVIDSNIRKLNYSKLPPKVDFIVGSPPCTQFSYSNKGGGGDLEDGLKDLYAFLKIVKKLKPKYWAMENVPRVSKILSKVLDEDDDFKPFKSLFNFNEVVSADDYGLPQARKRMIAGFFPFELFEKYKENLPSITMSEAISGLRDKLILDYLYEYTVPSSVVSGLENEKPLTDEEIRMNSDSKVYHPVYNKMSFPDNPLKPSRTITCTCTRVSRESIVIEDRGSFRRLNLRERATVQGFPVTFDFYGNSYGDQLKMVGNAIPPVLTYYIANAMLKVRPQNIVPINKLNYEHPKPNGTLKAYPVNTFRSNYPQKRNFRFAVPGLRFGSGVRFEVANKFEKDNCFWEMRFFYGNSKDIRRLKLGMEYMDELKLFFTNSYAQKLDEKASNFFKKLKKRYEPERLQEVWNHSITGNSPFKLLDEVGLFAESIKLKIKSNSVGEITNTILNILNNLSYEDHSIPTNEKKIDECSHEIVSGLILGAYFNLYFR